MYAQRSHHRQNDQELISFRNFQWIRHISCQYESFLSKGKKRFSFIQRNLDLHLFSFSSVVAMYLQLVADRHSRSKMIFKLHESIARDKCKWKCCCELWAWLIGFPECTAPVSLFTNTEINQKKENIIIYGPSGFGARNQYVYVKCMSVSVMCVEFTEKLYI